MASILHWRAYAKAAACVPEDFYDQVAYHLPPENPVGRKGDRPPIPHREALQVIRFILATG